MMGKGGCFDFNLLVSINDFLESHKCPSKLKVSYGLPEVSGVCINEDYLGKERIENEINSVGIPNLYTTVRIENPITKEPLKYNEIGEIVISGKSVMMGYFDNPELTKMVIKETEEGRFFHTGDLNYVDEDGCLYVKGKVRDFNNHIEENV